MSQLSLFEKPTLDIDWFFVFKLGSDLWLRLGPGVSNGRNSYLLPNPNEVAVLPRVVPRSSKGTSFVGRILSLKRSARGKDHLITALVNDVAD